MSRFLSIVAAVACMVSPAQAGSNAFSSVQLSVVDVSIASDTGGFVSPSTFDEPLLSLYVEDTECGEPHATDSADTMVEWEVGGWDTSGPWPQFRVELSFHYDCHETLLLDSEATCELRIMLFLFTPEGDGIPGVFGYSYRAIVVMGSGENLIVPETISMSTSKPQYAVPLPSSARLRLTATGNVTALTPCLPQENQAPIADAGADRTVALGDTVLLDAGNSSDPDGASLLYDWSLLFVADGSTAEIAEPTAKSTSFVADRSGAYVVNLVVSDGDLESEPATATITAVPVADAAMEAAEEIAEALVELPTDGLQNANTATPLINKLNAIQDMIDRGAYRAALNQLKNDVLPKTDGCALTGEPDRNDWLVTCEAQAEVYPLVIRTIELLERLI